jgi:hypothetical protein
MSKMLAERSSTRKRTSPGLSLFLLDIDHFKNYNDCQRPRSGLTGFIQLLSRLVLENIIAQRWTSSGASAARMYLAHPDRAAPTWARPWRSPTRFALPMRDPRLPPLPIVQTPRLS